MSDEAAKFDGWVPLTDSFPEDEVVRYRVCSECRIGSMDSIVEGVLKVVSDEVGAFQEKINITRRPTFHGIRVHPGCILGR